MIDITNILITIAIVIGAALLEVWLSKFETWIPGLVLPLITLSISIINVLGYTHDPAQPYGEYIAVKLSTFLMFNIPTLLLLGIYFFIRRKMRIKNSVDKTKFKDL